MEAAGLTFPSAHQPIPPSATGCPAGCRTAAARRPCISLLKSQVVDVLLDHSQDLVALGNVCLDDLLSSRFLRDQTATTGTSVPCAKHEGRQGAARAAVLLLTHRSSLLDRFLLLCQVDLIQLGLESLQLFQVFPNRSRCLHSIHAPLPTLVQKVRSLTHMLRSSTGGRSATHCDSGSPRRGAHSALSGGARHRRAGERPP